jgi:transcriptional regulator with XRE-family HTH domain
MGGKNMFGVRARYFRKKRGLSQQELSQMIDKPQTTISDWENGKYLPDVNDAVKLATALGVNLTDLLDEPPARAAGE